MLHNLLRSAPNKEISVGKVGDEYFTNIGPLRKKSVFNLIERRQFSKEFSIQRKLEATASSGKGIIIQLDKVGRGLLKLLKEKGVMKRRIVQMRGNGGSHLSPGLSGGWMGLWD